jgi:3-hydroxyisobutyrate dehydrogenase
VTLAVAFIGLGTMGSRMAANLVRAGFEVTVHNRTREKEEPLEELGASRAGSPAEAADGAEVIVTIVSDTSDVEQVLFGEQGVIEGVAPGAVVVDMSTIDPKATRGFAARLYDRQVGYVDAPVSGGSEGARDATLSIMVGGEETHVARVRPVLEALGDQITHIGGAGSGQATKAVNQVIVAGTFLAVAEGMLLGIRSGLDMEKVLEAVGAGAAGSWALRARAPRMLERKYPLGFKVALHRKDLAIALASARRTGATLPAASLVAELEDRLIEKGLADADVSAIIEAIWDGDGSDPL